MAEVMDRAEVRRRIDALELLDNIHAAIDDIQSSEFVAGETLTLVANSQDGEVARIRRIPPAMLVRALQALASEAA